uniref:Uncharacterized protein n=1 Tax=Musa acuminata subsp. malaccensis TaxID=214687 RepID=A0A804L5K2_MUSAM
MPNLKKFYRSFTTILR